MIRKPDLLVHISDGKVEGYDLVVDQQLHATVVLQQCDQVAICDNSGHLKITQASLCEADAPVVATFTVQISPNEKS